MSHKISPSLALIIHEFLHSQSPGSELIFRKPDDTKIKTEIVKESGSTYMICGGFKFVKQNKGSSLYGRLAEKGRKITWVTGNNRKLRIIDDTLYLEDSKFKKPK